MKSIRSMNILDSKLGSEFGFCVFVVFFVMVGIVVLLVYVMVLI